MANNVLSAISAAGILVTLVTTNNGAPKLFGHRQYHFLRSDGSRCSKAVNVFREIRFDSPAGRARPRAPPGSTLRTPPW